MDLKDLTQLLAQPTAPFREDHVKATLTAWFKQDRIPYFEDPSGNLVVGAPSAKAYQALIRKKTKEPLRIFIAHMDHPGFHGVKWEGDRLAIKWHGGSPIDDLPGTPVWLADKSGYVGEGILEKAEMASSGRPCIDTGELSVTDAGLVKTPAKKLWGGLRFRAPVWIEGETLYTKAADDLAGVYAILSLARSLYKKKGQGRSQSRENFIGLLTRAEEVGFIGTLAHLNWAKIKPVNRRVLVVSLEASRTLPGADVGKGPVVRLGDRATVFDAGASQVLTELAQKTLKKDYQRRLMDGGTCEATAATVYGLPAIGISLPLGNYHNQNFEGGPDSRGPNGSAPEFVHLKDLQGMVALCQALVAPGLPWDKPWKNTRARLDKSLHSMRKFL